MPAMSTTTEIVELVWREVAASLLSQDWSNEKKFISHLSKAVEKNIANGLSTGLSIEEEEIDRTINRKLEDQVSIY